MKLTAGLIDQAILQAAIIGKATSGPAYNAAFTRRLSEAVNQLPWNLVQDRVKELKGMDEMTTPSFLAGMIASDVQPIVEKSGAVDNQTA